MSDKNTACRTFPRSPACHDCSSIRIIRNFIALMLAVVILAHPHNNRRDDLVAVVAGVGHALPSWRGQPCVWDISFCGAARPPSFSNVTALSATASATAFASATASAGVVLATTCFFSSALDLPLQVASSEPAGFFSVALLSCHHH